MLNFAITTLICIVIILVGYIFILSIRYNDTLKEIETLKREKYKLMHEKELEEITRYDGGIT